MRKYHIPFDLISADGENDLHEKINQDIKFSEYLQDFIRLLDQDIKDKVQKERILDASRLVYIFAEIAAYREGFGEGIRFLSESLTDSKGSKGLDQHGKDFCTEFNKFIEEYKLDRIADVHGFLENIEIQNILHCGKSNYEKELLEFALEPETLINYLMSVDHLADEIKYIFYEY